MTIFSIYISKSKNSLYKRFTKDSPKQIWKLDSKPVAHRCFSSILSVIDNIVAGKRRGLAMVGQTSRSADFSCVRNLRYIIFGWDDLTVDLPFVQFMGVGLGHKLAWQ